MCIVNNMYSLIKYCILLLKIIEPKGFIRLGNVLNILNNFVYIKVEPVFSFFCPVENNIVICPMISLRLNDIFA